MVKELAWTSCSISNGTIHLSLVLEGQLAVVSYHSNASCRVYQVSRKDMGYEISKLWS